MRVAYPFYFAHLVSVNNPNESRHIDLFAPPVIRYVIGY
ncbi:hypothetical protein PL9631_40013 [Planktothrix paucivesiculata PCC 9631]|uniref:Uncharacterized protein n=1 Tax=Planktothrix paucivesiculata PCC 9631 TaxID=671071 RepID=A0A7Z9BNJ4_9CYAN|nr:hypothetical protein PL9631_40013 [Planktothrix paucivesiculata PCC 9631]